ncbi:MAG: hypothetical protein AAF739_07320 [Pseudomonadota bacterium]
MLFDSTRKDLSAHIMAGRTARSRAAYDLLAKLRASNPLRGSTPTQKTQPPRGHAAA